MYVCIQVERNRENNSKSTDNEEVGTGIYVYSIVL